MHYLVLQLQNFYNLATIPSYIKDGTIARLYNKIMFIFWFFFSLSPLSLSPHYFICFLSPPSLQIVLLFPLQTRSTSFLSLSLSNWHGDNPIRTARFQFWVNISFGNGFQFWLRIEVRWVLVVVGWVVAMVV